MLLSTLVSSINTNWSERRDDTSCINSSRSRLRSRAIFCMDFFDYLRPFKALLMLEGVTSTSKSLRRKSAMSLRRMQGSRESSSHKAVNIESVIVLRRPAPFDRAFVDPKRSRFRLSLRMARGVQLAILAICHQ